MLDKVDKVAEMGVKNPKEDYTDVTLAVGDTFLDDFSGMVPPPTQEEQIQEDQIQEEQKQEGPNFGTPKSHIFQNKAHFAKKTYIL